MDGAGSADDFETLTFNPNFTNLVLLVGASGQWHLDNLVLETVASPSVATEGMVSWWRAEGNPLDSWGTNHGSATAKYEPGKVGQCFTAASETRIPHSASLQLTNALTIEAWVNPSPSVLPNRSIVSKFQFAQFGPQRTASYYLGLGHGNYLNGPVFMLTPTGFEAQAIRLAPFTNLVAGQWSHLAATYDGATMRLYLNGTLLAQTNYTGGIWPGTNDLGIGSTPLSGSSRTYNRFNGRIDEVSIYHCALSDANVAAIYEAGSAGKTIPPPCGNPPCFDSPPGLISWWPGDGNTMDVTGQNPLLPPGSNIGYATGMVVQAFNFVPTRTVPFVRSSPTINFGSNASFSAEVWMQVKPTPPLSGNVPLLEKRTVGGLVGSDQTGQGYSLALRDGRLAFWLSPNLAASNAAPFVSSGPDLRDGKYHHVGVSVERSSTNGGKLFVDGKVVLTFDPVPRNGNLSNTAPLYLGWPTTSVSNRVFVGQMDEPALYNRALTEAEMQGIWLAGSNGKCKTPPFLMIQPMDQRVVDGHPVALSVVAGGVPELSYQWFLNGAAIRLATNWNYFFQAASNNAGVYSVRVTNAFGSVLSSNVTIKLNHPPVPIVRLFTRFRAATNDSAFRFIAPDGAAAQVLFDASLSSDEDGDPLHFRWWNLDSQTSFGTGTGVAVVTNTLPVGRHHLVMWLNDRYVWVTTELTLDIITAADAVNLLDEHVAAADIHHGHHRALQATLDNAARALEAGKMAAGLLQLEKFEDQIQNWVAPEDLATANQWTWIAAQIVAAVDAPNCRASRFRLQAHGHNRGSLTFEGGPGRGYLIECSPDLNHWEPLGAASEIAPGQYEFTVPDFGRARQCFYRLRAW